MNMMLRSLLFVPGSRPERFEKALNSGADMICIDLEDAVLPRDKVLARQAVVSFIKQHPGICVRINPTSTDTGMQDLAALSANKPAAVMLAKCDNVEDVELAQQLLGCAQTTIIPLIETINGLENAAEIAAASGAVKAMMLGGADMAAELGCEFSYEPLLYVRSQLVVAAAKAGVSLIDVPFVDIKDQTGLDQETRKVRALGFAAKAAIHPNQIPTIHQAFMPTEAQIEYAQAVMEAVDSPDAGVVVVKGRMVDRPIILASQRVLALAEMVNKNG